MKIEEKESEEKEGKSRERTIQEVIQLVKRWRQLNQKQDDPQKKRFNLQEAAKIVGVSKKSLDDYYCQLRLGELYDFDFVNHLYEKIGVLRYYIKEFKFEKSHKKRKGNQKHPKHLKIINYYDLQLKRFKNSDYCPIKREEKREKEDTAILKVQETEKVEIKLIEEQFKKEEIVSLANLDASCEPRQIFDLEHDFFKDFEVQMAEQKDPYYDADMDFRIKDNDFDSLNSLLFFD